MAPEQSAGDRYRQELTRALYTDAGDGSVWDLLARQSADKALDLIPDLLSDEAVLEAIGDTIGQHEGKVTPGRLARMVVRTISYKLANP
jgi:hypothetical protein